MQLCQHRKLLTYPSFYAMHAASAGNAIQDTRFLVEEKAHIGEDSDTSSQVVNHTGSHISSDT